MAIEVHMLLPLDDIEEQDFLYNALLNYRVFKHVTEPEDLEKLTRHHGNNVLSTAFVGEYRVLDGIPGDYGSFLLVRSDLFGAARARVLATLEEKKNNIRVWFEGIRDKPFYLGILYEPSGEFENLPVDGCNFTRDFLKELTCPCHESQDAVDADRPCGHSVYFLGEFIVRLTGLKFDDVKRYGRFSIEARVLAARGPEQGDIEQQHPKGTTINIVPHILWSLRSPQCYINDGGVLNCGGCYLALFCELAEARAAAPSHVGLLSDAMQALSLDYPVP